MTPPLPASWGPRLKRWGLRLAVAWLLVTVLPVLVFRFVDPPTTAFMLQRRLEALWNQERHFTLRQKWTPLERVSPQLRLAVIAAEDQKFPEHFGFDVEAIEDAIEDRLEGKSRRGASTLTQQVAKNLFLWPGRSFVRKGLEAYFTVLLELCWPKWRILEVHLNVAEFGNGVYGVDAASRMAFGVPPSAVDAHQAALMAAVLPSPRTRRITAPTPAVAERVGWIEDQARRLGLSTVTQLGP
ncbi:MAG: monofunctional biosynthetic peptidoglycan transglycosylase [Myxococcota bacterium]